MRSLPFLRARQFITYWWLLDRCFRPFLSWTIQHFVSRSYWPAAGGLLRFAGEAAYGSTDNECCGLRATRL